MDEAVLVASRMGLVEPNNHVVVVQRMHESFCVKVISVDELGRGNVHIAACSSIAPTCGCHAVCVCVVVATA